LYTSNLVLLANTKPIDINKKPYELDMKPDSKIMAVCALSADLKPPSSKMEFKFWRRFRDTRSDGWYIGGDRWDSVAFQPRRDVRVYGIGIFAPYPLADHSFRYGYKYLIQAAGNQQELHNS
jgi:hypothetical protein